MKIKVRGIEEGQPVPEKFAFGVYSEQDHMSFGPNRNPELVWEDAPEGTKSFVVMMFDPDVPSVADDVNQEGKTVPADLERVDFFHWLSLKAVFFQPTAAFLLAFQAGLVERIWVPFLSPRGLVFQESSERISPPGPPLLTASTAMMFLPFFRIPAILARTGVDHSFEETAFLPLIKTRMALSQLPVTVTDSGTEERSKVCRK